MFIEVTDAADESASVGKVDVMQSRADGCARQPVVAGLERSRRIGDGEQTRPSATQRVQAGNVDVGSVERLDREQGTNTLRENVKARGVAGNPDHGDA